MPEIKKYLSKEGLIDYTERMPHSAEQMQEFISDWLDEHPEATTTVQDDTITTPKLHNGAVTEPKLADESVSLRTLAPDTLNLLKGALITGELSGEILTATDTYAAPPMVVTVEGKSTQSDTPTPENPAPIESLEAGSLAMHASAAGTSDATNWPILLAIPQTMRSLPDGTKDTLTLTYLKPSTREGWAWYSRKLVQRCYEDVMSGPSDYSHKRYTFESSLNFNVTLTMQPDFGANVQTNISGWMCDSLQVARLSNGANQNNWGESNQKLWPNSITKAYASTTQASVCLLNSLLGVTSDDTIADIKAAIDAYLQEHPITLCYQLETPITTQLEPIELPTLPAPNLTVWSDPSTGLQIQYVRDSNIVIQRIEEAIADL